MSGYCRGLQCAGLFVTQSQVTDTVGKIQWWSPGCGWLEGRGRGGQRLGRSESLPRPCVVRTPLPAGPAPEPQAPAFVPPTIGQAATPWGTRLSAESSREAERLKHRGGESPKEKRAGGGQAGPGRGHPPRDAAGTPREEPSSRQEEVLPPHPAPPSLGPRLAPLSLPMWDRPPESAERRAASSPGSLSPLLQKGRPQHRTRARAPGRALTTLASPRSPPGYRKLLPSPLHTPTQCFQEPQAGGALGVGRKGSSHEFWGSPSGLGRGAGRSEAHGSPGLEPDRRRVGEGDGPLAAGATMRPRAPATWQSCEQSPGGIPERGISPRIRKCVQGHEEGMWWPAEGATCWGRHLAHGNTRPKQRVRFFLDVSLGHVLPLPPITHLGQVALARSPGLAEPAAALDSGWHVGRCQANPPTRT